ncbi:MAG: hypothetical protein CO129_01150 [Ignavibacteriales bacterium CG_4_9_14_3_um_filter_34_10]|nr:MAG: hypothetical protein CO129_01150 [Ignavibacteriales bacterium CG_4_9_14_3_um_filter_34_10]
MLISQIFEFRLVRFLPKELKQKPEMKSAILFSKDQNLIKDFLDTCSNNGIGFIKESDFANFVYELQHESIDLIIYDFQKPFDNGLKHIKIIRKIKPKTSLIVVADELPKAEGGKIYEENIFHLEIKPIQKNFIQEIVIAGINSNRNNFENT